MTSRYAYAVFGASSIVLLASAARAQSATLAFVHDNVVPMTSDTVLREHTVLVAHGGRSFAVDSRASRRHAPRWQARSISCLRSRTCIRMRAIRADLLIVSSNSLTDLDALRSPANIVRLGRIYSTAQLDSIRRAN